MAQVEPLQWEASPQAVQPSAAPAPEPVRAADRAAQLPDLERDAFAKGYAQGERSGAEAAAVRADAMLRRLAETLEELTALRAEMIRRTERQLTQLALAIAKRVVAREVTIDRGLLAAMARVALDRLGEHASATIRLHPDDYAAISAGREPVDATGQVTVVADPLVSRGGCLVQSDFGFMDVSPQAQFEELARTLLEDGETVATPVASPRGVDAFARS